MEISLRKNKQQVATAIAIAGRSCRPCDVCGRDQARWFCAADEAYLCGQCDGSVHGANAVASKHERTLLGPGGLPSLKLPSAMASTYCHRSKKHSVSGSSAFGSRKKPRSIRHHSHTTVANSSAEIRTKATSNVVKNEPDSPETSPTIASLKLENEFSAHEVPIFLPSEPELLLPAFHCDCSNSFMMNAISSDRIATEEAETGLKYAIKGLLESRLEQRSREEEMQMSTSDDELTIVDEMGLFGMCDESLVNADYGLDFSSIEAFEDWKNASEGEVAEAMEAVDHVSGLNDGLSWRVKMEEVEDDDEAEKLKLEVDELLACALITGFKEEHEEEEAEAMERKVSLKLDYEDVLSAWSDRGSLWTDGRRPQIVPEDCEFDTARSLDIGLVPDLNFCSTTVVQQQYFGLEQVGLVPVANMGDQDTLTANCGREARVMRYREKRRTRLFSKKIRYEVRKLNAEMRPRWKGRFVKRSAGLS